MRLHPSSPTLRRITLLASALVSSALIQMPAFAAGNLGQFTKGTLAPADITGAVIFGKNGEVVTLDAKGNPLKACSIAKTPAEAAKAGNKSLPECESSHATGGTAAPKAKDSTPCEGFFVVWIGGVPIQIWYPAGCTPPN